MTVCIYPLLQSILFPVIGIIIALIVAWVLMKKGKFHDDS